MRMKLLLHQLEKKVFFFVLLSFVKTKGGARTDCEVTDTVLKCKFSENINSSRTDFSVHFRPEKGREELLVECAWLGEKFHCLKQEGFACDQPVSDSAVIVVPPQIVHRPGSYRCAASGSQARDTRTCRFHERPAKEQLAACEVNSILGGQQAVLKCRFSFRVYAFSVQQSTNVVANYTKSLCQNNELCEYKLEDGDETFTVKLNTSDYEDGEFLCQPDLGSSRLEVKGCSLTKNTKGAYILTAAMIVLAVVITSLSVGVPALIIRRKIKKNRESNSSNTTDSLIDNSVTQEKTTGLRARARKLWGYAKSRKLERVGG